MLTQLVGIFSLNGEMSAVKINQNFPVVNMGGKCVPVENPLIQIWKRNQSFLTFFSQQQCRIDNHEH